ncbi:MAG: glutamate--tRNA ligase [Candidatus Omnitrophica bacterium]|nr:glutamate--tRNA ligase [Candidatus Omnitrophota bacterium]MBU4488278.1 glutamate--tRNA ligase [Candidatus Omnitrophota bacterium]
MVRVRFAPSPTGFLHIGSARSALFNWLFARHEKGSFLLRIEDTDKARSKDEFLEEILASLKWLGMESDEPLVFQSERLDLYLATAEKLLKEDKAYREENAIRFKMPKKKIRFNDICRNEIEFDSEVLKDEVLIKSDGFPTYNFACVIDDADMKITHVVRGDDHISNTPKQIAIYEALKLPIPKFAHIPLIMGPDGGRLSKRHGATSIMEYRKMGYLSDTLVNFLALMGWAPGGDREILPVKEIVKEFTLEKVNRTSAIFNIDKLNWLNGQYLKEKDSKELLELLIPLLLESGIISEDFDREKLLRLIELYKIRIKTLADFEGHIRAFYTDELDYDPAGTKEHLKKEGTKLILSDWQKRISSISDFNVAALEKNCKQLASELGIKPARIIHSTRMAISGTTQGAGLFEMMEVMGKDTVLTRLDYAIKNFAL